MRIDPATREQMEAARVAIRIRIHGRVQGVWYRGWTVETAAALALDGWVRNRRDGTVEALLAGSAEAVRSMIERCRAGPPAARVRRFEVPVETGRVEAGFRQLPTS
jgi:acylphosphatase